MARRPRAIAVDDPADGEPLHTLRIADGAVATSGITRRAWTGEDGGHAHQIIDPASGRPAFTGVVQVTALAPTGLLAETFAKAALLTGPEDAKMHLPYGGVIVETGGMVRIVEPLGSVLPAVVA
jgi:thiamine biosynthesis lipoprotein